MGDGVEIPKYFSKYPAKYSERDVRITGDNGELIEELKGAVFPDFWSQHAANTTSSKYFRQE